MKREAVSTQTETDSRNEATESYASTVGKPGQAYAEITQTYLLFLARVIKVNTCSDAYLEV